MKAFSLRDENGKLYYGWVIAVLAAIVTGLVYNGIVSTTGVMMLPVITEMAFDPPAFSLYLTIMSITGIITLLIVQRFFTKQNIKKIMLIAGICGVVSFIGFAMAKNITMFYIFSIPQGFCFTAMTMTPCQLLVSNWFGAKAKGRAMSIFMTGMTLVYVGELNILQRVVTTSGWRAGYYLLGGGIVIAIICVFFIKWSPEDKGVKRMGDLTEEELAAMQMKSSLASGIDFRDAIKKPITWLIFLSATLAVIASSSVLQHGIPTMVYGGYTPEKATAIVSMLSTIMLVTGPVIGIIMDKAPLRVAAFGSALCFAGSCVGLSLITTNPALGVPVFCCLYIFGVASINIISPVIMSFLFGEKSMNKLLSWLNMFIGVGGALGALGVSTMLVKFGTYQIPWLIMAGVLFICAIIRFFATSKKLQYKPGNPENQEA